MSEQLKTSFLWGEFEQKTTTTGNLYSAEISASRRNLPQRPRFSLEGPLLFPCREGDLKSKKLSKPTPFIDLKTDSLTSTTIKLHEYFRSIDEYNLQQGSQINQGPLGE